MAQVVLNKAGKTYPGGVRAVEGVDLTIADGEFLVLVGPSGCGKSTTLRMVAGLEEITDGTISIDGSVVNDLHARDRDIAMVFQNYALYPHMTVTQNLAFGLERRRAYPSLMRSIFSSSYRKSRNAESAAIAKRVQDAAETLEIQQLLDRYPRALSGGQRQRVALGRALVRNPKVFLFDEPLSNLDAKLRVEMRTELRILHRELRATMIYVTHDQEEAMTLGDRLVVMDSGHVQQVDTPANIYEQPANRFVAGFVGTPTMNFIEGTIDQSGRFVSEHGSLDLPATTVGTFRGECVLGIRPDVVEPTSSEDGFSCTIEAVEYLGDRVDLVLRCGALQIVCRTEPTRAFEEGATLSVRPRVDGTVHLFENTDAGVRIA